MLSRTLDPCGIIRVQSWDADASAPSALDQLVGTAWPRKVGTVASGLVDILCIAPTEWLLISRNPDDCDLYKNLAKAMTGTLLRPTDLSQALTRIELEGPETRDLLLKGCSLDLHPDRFLPGQCTRTRFAGLPTVFRCLTPSRFEGIVAASYREYLLAWIADASA